MEERLQKILAQAGIGSRRECEQFIEAGRVRVNGAVAIIGQKANASTDKITVDGRTIQAPEQKIYIALHKPRFVLSTVETEYGDTRKTVRDLVPVSERLYPVGRLDFESEGLILMTNDGDLANRLTHPTFGHEKEYRVLVARQPDAEQLAVWRRGVVLEDGYKTMPAEVRLETVMGKGAWLRVIMKEGRKRQIREIGAKLGLPIVRILRIRIGTLHLGTLKPTEWRYLSPQEVETLRTGMGTTQRRRSVPDKRRFKRTHSASSPSRSEEKREPEKRKTGKQPPPSGPLARRGTSNPGAPRRKTSRGKQGSG